MNRSRFNTDYVWGIGSYNNWYQKDSQPPTEGHIDLRTYFELEYVEMDIHLNLDGDTPKVRICVVSNDKPMKEVMLCHAKDNDRDGFHISIYIMDIQELLIIAAPLKQQ